NGAEYGLRQIELVRRLAVFHVEPLGQQRLAALDHVEIRDGQPGRGTQIDLHHVAAFVDRLVEPQDHVFANRIGIDSRDERDGGATRVRDLRLNFEVALLAPPRVHLAAEHLDVLLPPVGLAEPFRLWRNRELGQTGFVGPHLRERFFGGFLVCFVCFVAGSNGGFGKTREGRPNKIFFFFFPPPPRRLPVFLFVWV